MVIKNVTKQVMPFMLLLSDGSRVQKILRPNQTFELFESEVTPDVEGKIKKKFFKVVE
jgi:hypothetical protein